MTAPLERTVNPQELDPQTVRLLPYPFAKSKGVLAQGARLKGRALALELFHRGRHALRRLLIEPYARRRRTAAERNDCFECAPLGKSNHGCATGLRFERYDAEVFDPGKEQSTATAVMIADLLGRLPTQKLGLWPC